MKKIISILIVTIIGVFLVISCTKNNEDNSKQAKAMELRFDFSKLNGAIPEDLCGDLGHNYTTGFGASWNVATCKSNCSKGIGFRCGKDLYLVCKDGAHIPMGFTPDKCPKSNIQNRAMTASFIFYENNTLKLLFHNPIPIEEADNNTFEIEDDETIFLPNYLTINGTFYSSLFIPKGNYTINREDGEHGSVTFPITLIE